MGKYAINGPFSIVMLNYQRVYMFWLVVWNMIFYDFPYIGNVIIPTDELLFFRGVGIHQPVMYVSFHPISDA